MRWRVTKCVGAMVLFLASVDSGAQAAISKVRVPDTPACRQCRIERHVVATLRVPSDTTDGFPIGIRTDGKRLWVFRRGELPALFDQTGKFLQVFGRRGRGPGEYLQPYDMVVLTSDSVLLFDGDGQRASILDQELRFVRSVVMPFEMHGPVVLSWPDAVLASGILPTASGAGWPLHRVAFTPREAKPQASFGYTDGELRPDGVPRMWHWITPPAAGRIWAAWMYGYTLTQWDMRGKLLRVLERSPSWFKQSSPSSIGTPSRPPPPFMADIHVDGAGLLWTFVHVPAPNWRSAWPRLPAGAKEVDMRTIAKELMHVTTVEVIDPEAGRVLARRTFQNYGVPGLSGNRFAFYEVGDDGSARITIVALSLVR